MIEEAILFSTPTLHWPLITVQPPKSFPPGSPLKARSRAALLPGQSGGVLSSEASHSGKPRVNPAESRDFNPRVPVSRLRLRMGTVGTVPAPWPGAEVLSAQDMQREVVPQ